LRESFQNWANDMLPGNTRVLHPPYLILIILLLARAGLDDKGAPTGGPAITYSEDKSPRLPLVDLKTLPPKVVTELLEMFIQAAWSRFCVQVEINMFHRTYVLH